MIGLDAADWNLRSTKEFGELRALTHTGTPLVCMELFDGTAVREASCRKGWSQLCRAWKAMPPHPHALELVDVIDDHAALKFAAIAWGSRPVGDWVATCAKLTSLFEHIVASVPHEDWVWFQCPRVAFDLRGEPRVWWQPATSTSVGIAPEARTAWPHCSEKMLVYVLGRLMADVGASNDQKGLVIVKSCIAPQPGSRIARLKEVRISLQFVSRTRPTARDPAWDLVEQGIGWLELPHREAARERFAAALEHSPDSELAAQGIARTDRPVVLDFEQARKLESDGWWVGAIDAYRQARHSMAPADYLASLARCMLATNQLHKALELATKASSIDPSLGEAWQVIARAAVAADKLPEARVACERLAAIEPAMALKSLEEIIGATMVRGKYAEARQLTVTLVSLTAAGDPQRGIETLGQVADRIPPADALGLCEQIYTLSPPHGLQAFVALAGRLASATPTDAIAICERLHALSPPHAMQAFATTVEAIFQRGAHADALAIADRFVALAPDAAIAHYRRGRCLFGLNRLVDAHAALVRAEQLDPKLVEAMLVRREVDRALANVKAVVGTAVAMPLQIPEHLTEVRAAMARGTVDEAVAWLEGHDLGDSARLLLGHLLVGQQRFADAVKVFDRVSGELVHDAALGKARALSGLGRGEEALRLLDRVCAENPELTEAVIVRARVVAMLRGVNPRA